jgi:hypothetical protein
MKKLIVLYVALCAGLLTPAAFARGGGMGSHGMSAMGGVFGTSAAAPGTNSAGTALSSSGVGHGPMNGSLLGTSPGIDREEAKVEKMIGSICRGCWRLRMVRLQMHTQRKAPMLATAFVAVVGAAVILFNDFNSGAGLQASDKARAITAAAVSRAGAIEILPEPSAGRKVSWATQLTNGNPASPN